jgi:hypothetical protein
MILAIPDCGESFVAEVALIWLLTRMSPHMNEQISFFCKYFTTTMLNTFKQIMTAVSALDMQIEP